MNTLNIGEILFVHTLRKRGFIVSVLAIALILLSLSAVTAFGLGRELIMVREAGFGTLYVASFLGALLAGIHASGRGGNSWAKEVGTRPVGRASFAVARLLHSVLAGFWVALFLTPFLVASFGIFHGKTIPVAVCLLAGLILPLAGFRLESLGLPLGWAKMIPVSLSAGLSVAMAGCLPGGENLVSVLLFSPAPILLATLLPGALIAIWPGPGGWILSLGMFTLANMREAMVHSFPLGKVLSLMPDLSNLNPSLVVMQDAPLRPKEILYVFAYSAVWGLGVLAVTAGVATLKKERI